MKKLHFICTLFFILLFSCKQSEPLLLQGKTMGTTYHIKIMDKIPTDLSASAVQLQIDSLLTDINRQMSTYIPSSEISQFNRAPAGKTFSVSADFMKVLRLALVINRQSGGAFDVTVGPLVDLWGFGKKGGRTAPPKESEINALLTKIGSASVSILNDSTITKTKAGLQLDFGAIAKGYGVDAVARLLKQTGFGNFMVEIGGEVKVCGQKGDEKWRIGIDRPEAGLQPGEQLQGVLQIKDIAAATSGDYRNYFLNGDSLYSHEIDPRTGRPVQNGVASATVLAPSCMLADAMATAIMIMGAEKGLEWVETKPDVQALIIVHDGKNFKEIQSSAMDVYLK